MVTAAAISAGAAVAGTVLSTAQLVGGQSSGVHISRTNIHYPQEVPHELFHGGQLLNFDIMKFSTSHDTWRNELAVAVSGQCSATHDPVVAYPAPTQTNPNVPANRYLAMHFFQSGNSEDMSSGLLEVNISAWGGDQVTAIGSADDPWIPLMIDGRFDPVGYGDVHFQIGLLVNTFGHIAIQSETHNGTGTLTVTDGGGFVQVYLSQMPFMNP